ncbi:MAG TPA: hypothetical protein VG713_10300, partial [Pirellulales bacterium]|nr:hypothetical protein [Pirellulales bacterium]
MGRLLAAGMSVSISLLLVRGLIAAEPTGAPVRVRLVLDWPAAAADDIEFPVYSGLSLPQRLATSVESVAVVDHHGRTVACGHEALSHWHADRSLKWVGLHFLARKGAQYFAVVGNDPGPPAGGLRIENRVGALVVDCGVARFSLPHVGALFGAVSVAGRDLLARNAACLIVKDQHGRVADETRGTASEAPQVEFADGQFAVVRREGTLQTAEGVRLGRYVVRLEFQAGSAVVKLQHSFINTEDTSELQ